MRNNHESNRSVNGQHDRSIDFKGIAAAALASAKSLLHEWLPGGRFEGREYVALNPTRNDRALGSFKINWQTGEWSDFADPNAKGGDLISLFAYINRLDQDQAARQIAEKLGISPCKTNGAAPRTRTIVMPVPADAPAPPATHPKLGRPTKSWPYKDAAGGVIGYVLRFDRADGKEFRPLTLWRDSVSGRLEWRWESWPTPRPLYGLQELADWPFAPVVVCEGEKAT